MGRSGTDSLWSSGLTGWHAVVRLGEEQQAQFVELHYSGEAMVRESALI